MRRGEQDIPSAEDAAMLPANDLFPDTALAALTPRERAALGAAMSSATYRSGTPLHRPDLRGARLIVVRAGVVRLYRRAPDGAEATTALVHAGGIFGLLAPAADAAAPPTCAEALGAVRTLEIPAATLLALGDRSPRLLAEVGRWLIARIALSAAANSAAGAAVPERLLHVLRCLARPPVDGGSPGTAAMVVLAVRVSHADLARLIGADRATVTRALGALAARGLVCTERGHVSAVAAGHGPAGCGRRGPA